MWALYGWLLAKGMVAYTNVKFNKPTSFVGIYPEIMHGNFGGADYVVRYILNKPGVMGGGTDKSNLKPGPTKFNKTDHLYYFSRLFGEAQDANHYLFLPVLNMNLFKPQGKQRTKKAVFIGKDYDLHLHPQDCIYLTPDICHDQAKLADFMSECEVMYCYDRLTAMTEIARLCGCRVVMFNPIFTKKEFSEYEPGMDGISWGKDEGVPLNVERFRAHYNEMKDVFSRKLNDFIVETQK